MSDDDPNDDELERDQVNPMVASRGARPRLSSESRAIDLAEIRSQEVMPSEARRQADYQPPPRRQPAPQQAAPRRSPLAPVVPLRPEHAGVAAADAVISSFETERAWVTFAAAALPMCVGLEDPEGSAALVADRMLEERKARFG
jgi:hypothetical protein